MAFVRKVKTASGATAVQIAERVAGRDRVLEHLGSAHTDAELSALLAAARNRLHPGQGELDLAQGRVPTGHAVITGKRGVMQQLVTTDFWCAAPEERMSPCPLPTRKSSATTWSRSPVAASPGPR